MKIIKNLIKEYFVFIIITFLTIVYLAPISSVVYRSYIKEKVYYTVDVTFLNGKKETKIYYLPDDTTFYRTNLDGVYVFEYDFGILETDVKEFKVLKKVYK